ARIVVVAHRTVQLTLGVEHVDDVAGTDLVADLGGFQRALVGDDRLATGLHGLDVGVQGAVQVAGGLDDLATQVFALVLGLVDAAVGLADLRAGQAAAVQRDVQLQADAALLGIAAVAGQALVVDEAEAVVVAALVLGDGVDGRSVAGLALTQGLFGGDHG